MRILIVRLGSIGDIVHTLPSVAAIRRAHPEAEISWVVERRASEILRDLHRQVTRLPYNVGPFILRRRSLLLRA